jgi:hypothetical protein
MFDLDYDYSASHCQRSLVRLRRLVFASFVILFGFGTKGVATPAGGFPKSFRVTYRAFIRFIRVSVWTIGIATSGVGFPKSFRVASRGCISFIRVDVGMIGVVTPGVDCSKSYRMASRGCISLIRDIVSTSGR